MDGEESFSSVVELIRHAAVDDQTRVVAPRLYTQALGEAAIGLVLEDAVDDRVPDRVGHAQVARAEDERVVELVGDVGDEAVVLGHSAADLFVDELDHFLDRVQTHLVDVVAPAGRACACAQYYAGALLLEERSVVDAHLVVGNAGAQALAYEHLVQGVALQFTVYRQKKIKHHLGAKIYEFFNF